MIILFCLKVFREGEVFSGSSRFVSSEKVRPSRKKLLKYVDCGIEFAES